MFAQPSTDAFKPTINPPATAEPDVVELVGTDGDGGTAAGTLGAGCVDLTPPVGAHGRGAGFRLVAPV